MKDKLSIIRPDTRRESQKIFSRRRLITVGTGLLVTALLPEGLIGCGTTDNTEIPQFTFAEKDRPLHQKILVVPMKSPTDEDPFDIRRTETLWNTDIKDYFKRASWGKMDPNFHFLSKQWNIVNNLGQQDIDGLTQKGSVLIKQQSINTADYQTIMYFYTHSKNLGDRYYGNTQGGKEVFINATPLTPNNEESIEHEETHVLYAAKIYGHDQRLIVGDAGNFEDLSQFVPYGGVSLMGDKSGYACAFVRYALGWLPKEQIQNITKDTHKDNYILSHMQEANKAGQTKVLRIPLSNGRAYWIELASQIDFYSHPGLQVRVTDENPSSDTFQIVPQDLDPKTHAIIPRMEFKNGDEIYDKVNGVHLKLLQYTDDQYTGAKLSVQFDN